MITTLFYISLIWAFSLLLYAVQFRRLRLHRENRAYLLLSLALGLLLPLLAPEVRPDAATPILRQGISQSISLRRSVAASVAPAESAVQTSTILWTLYAGGALLALLFVLRQAVLLLRVYRRSPKVARGRLTIVRTDFAATPFSFFRTVFISPAAGYSAQEESMIVRHEGEHARLRHSLDVLFLLSLRILFWFNPLIHLYWKQLRLLHEYQADAVEEGNASAYGHFLLEQNMLGPIPVFTHSFYASPLKNRISMLLKTSTATRLRYTAALLLLPFFFFCCAWNAPRNERVKKGNKVYYNGNVIEMGGGDRDTMKVMDPVSGQESMLVTTLDSFPAKLNDVAIARDVLAPAKFSGEENDAAIYLFNQLKPALQNLEDGQYTIWLANPVVDANGKLVYYESRGISRSPIELQDEKDGSTTLRFPNATTNGGRKSADAAAWDRMQQAFAASPAKKNIDRKIDEALAGLTYKPAVLADGRTVPYLLSASDLDMEANRIIVVRNHQAQLRPTGALRSFR